MRATQVISVGSVALGLLAGTLVSGCSDDPAGVTGNPATPPAQQALSIQMAPSGSGDRQAAVVGSILPQPLQVLVRRGTEPASGVVVSWSTAQGHLSASQTLTSSSGIAAVAWTLGTLAGQQSAQASINDTPPDTGVSVVAFTAVANRGPASRLAFPVEPANVLTDRPFLQSIEVAVVDQYGNRAIDLTESVTVTLDPGGSLAGTTTVITDDGLATFTDLTIGQAGTGYILTATASGMRPARSVAFDVVTPGPGRIVFRNDRDGNAEIYSMNADGGGVVRLTANLAFDSDPSWSPDGTKLAFVSDRISAHDAIFTMNFDGTGVAVLTDSSIEPAWARDGTMLAGVRGTRTCVRVRGCRILYSRLIVMKADGSGQVVLANGTMPAWSPDGRVAFANGGDIYVINPDGTGLTDLTNSPGSSNLWPAWSPDGTKIAFRSNRAGHSDLYLMNADGSGITPVTTDSAVEGRPAWSPDGKRIAFGSTRTGSWEVYAMNADGSGAVQLTTTNGSVDPEPAWSP